MQKEINKNNNVNNSRVHRDYIHFVLRLRISKSTNQINTKRNYTNNIHIYTSKNLTRTITKLFRVPRHPNCQNLDTSLLYRNDNTSVIFKKHSIPLRCGVSLQAPAHSSRVEYCIRIKRYPLMFSYYRRTSKDICS